MIYLLLIFICTFITFVFLINYLTVFILNLNKNKNLYKAQKGNDKYFLLNFILKTIKPLATALKNAKISYIDTYSKKVTDMVKILKVPYTSIDGYNLILLQILSASAASFLFFLLIGYDFLILTVIAVLFFILPYLKIAQSYKTKINLILKQLPDLIDLLAVMVASGIDFNNALIKISKIADGVLLEEIETINSKISFGLPVQKAFEEFAQKYNLKQITMFVGAVNFSLQSGLGMADSLNKISQQLKTENASVAEKQAQQAPVKMLIPMTLLIFPTIFILLFAPILISFFKSGI